MWVAYIFVIIRSFFFPNNGTKFRTCATATFKVRYSIPYVIKNKPNEYHQDTKIIYTNITLQLFISNLRDLISHITLTNGNNHIELATVISMDAKLLDRLKYKLIFISHEI